MDTDNRLDDSGRPGQHIHKLGFGIQYNAFSIYAIVKSKTGVVVFESSLFSFVRIATRPLRDGKNRKGNQVAHETAFK